MSIDDLRWWHFVVIPIMFLFTWNIRKVLKWLGRSIDEDGDGKQSWSKEVVPVLFSIITCIVSIIEVSNDGDQISDLKFIFLCVSYLGASTVVAVLEVYNLRNKTINNHEDERP